MNETVEMLRAELAKRLAPWSDLDSKGNLVWREQLYTPVLLMPNQVQELLKVIDGKPDSELIRMDAIVEAFNTWPEDIRRKLSVHDLRRMTGWMPPS